MNFFRQVKDSFTNFSSYQNVSAQKAGKTFKYFFLLFTLIFIIQGTRFTYKFNAGTAEFVASVKDQIPEFTLANGKLKVEGQQPLLVEGTNSTALIIDTTGKTDESVLDKYNEGVFVSQDKVVNKQDFQRKEISFADMKQITLDKQKLMGYLPLIKWLLVIIGIFAYVFGSAWALITSFILALIGLIINSTMKGKLELGNSWNMAVYALTLPWLLEMLVNLILPTAPYLWAVKWGLAIFLLYKGIEATVKPAPNGEPPTPPNDVVI